jgi:hypothetical protein
MHGRNGRLSGWAVVGLGAFVVIVLGTTSVATAGEAPGTVVAPHLIGDSSGSSNLTPGPAGAAFTWSADGILVLVHDASYLPPQDLGLPTMFVSYQLLWGDGNNLTETNGYAYNQTYSHVYMTPGTYNVTEVWTYLVGTFVNLPGHNGTVTDVSIAYADVPIEGPGPILR